MQNKDIKKALLTAKRFTRKNYDSGGTPVQIDPVTGLPVPPSGGSEGQAQSSPTNGQPSSATGISAIDNAMANPGATAANLGAGLALGALGPVGMAISAANTVSGLFGGPTIGSTLVGTTPTTTQDQPAPAAQTAPTSSNAPAAPAAPAAPQDAQASPQDATTSSPTSTAPMGMDMGQGILGPGNYSNTDLMSVSPSYAATFDAMGPSLSGQFGFSGPVGTLDATTSAQQAQQGTLGITGVMGPEGLPTGSAQLAAMESTLGPDSAEQSALDAAQAGIDASQSAGIDSMQGSMDSSSGFGGDSMEGTADAGSSAGSEGGGGSGSCGSCGGGGSSGGGGGGGGDGGGGDGGGCYRGGAVITGKNKQKKTMNYIIKNGYTDGKDAKKALFTARNYVSKTGKKSSI